MLHERVLQRVRTEDHGYQTPCWIWTGATNKVNGYGAIASRRPDGSPTRLYVHRVVYEGLVAPIPPGMVIDHLCRVRACVNPAHLEAVTHAENMGRGKRARQTHCLRGHAFTPENTRVNARGRSCRACEADRKARLRADAR